MGYVFERKNLFQIKFFIDEVSHYREYITDYETYLSSLRYQGVLNTLEYTEEIKNEINNHKEKIRHQNALLSRSYFEILNNIAINILPSLFENKNLGELENINEGDEVEYITSNGIELKKYKETNFQKHKKSLKKKKTE